MRDGSIDVVIVTRNNNGTFQRCIDSIVKNTSFNTIGKMKVYVCTNGGAYDDVSSIMSNSGIMEYYVIEDKYNFARNTNRLVKMGKSDYVLYVNDDIKLIEDSISACKRVLDSDDNGMFGTIGIKLLFEDNTVQHAGHMLFLNSGNFIGVTHYGLRQPDMKLPDYVVVGNTFAFCMMRRSDVESAGFLDEGYQKCFEDVQMNWQMLMKGKVNVCLGSQTAYHYESMTRKGSGQLIERSDVMRLVSFFNDNKSLILQHKDDLTRTVIDKKGM